MPSITYECQDCGHQEERSMRKVCSLLRARDAPAEQVFGETDFEDEWGVIGEEVKRCVACGSTDITEYTEGLSLHDEGREDFHSDI